MRSQRRDRIARLLKIQIVLWQNPGGLSLKELMKRCSVSRSTIYRDLKALEYEVNVPLWEEGAKWGIAKGYFLPPINFTQAEAICVFQATRLMQKLTNRYDPGIYSTFLKLNSIVPSPINKYIQNTIDLMDKEPRNERIIKNFNTFYQAWMSQHSVKIIYQAKFDEVPKEYTVEPYFIEPVSNLNANYVIGYCQQTKSINAYNVNHILGTVVMEAKTFKIPDKFDINKYMSQAWGIHHWEKLETIMLHFNKKLGSTIKNTIWHPSQKVKILKDGSIIMTFRLRINLLFRHWIFIWGDEVEVLEPQSLRNEIIKFIEDLKCVYVPPIKRASST